jgi:outer membrane PBP1 activator LpoA protein
MAQFTLADVPGAFNRGLQFRQDTQLRPLEIAAAQQNVASAEQNFKAGEQNMQFQQVQQRNLEQDIKFRSDDRKNLDFVRSAILIKSLPDDQKLEALIKNRQTVIDSSFK